MNKLDEIAQVVRKHGDVMFLVDAVSSMAGTRIPVDELGIDGLSRRLAEGLFAPAGLTVTAVSDRALEKARGIENAATTSISSSCSSTTSAT